MIEVSTTFEVTPPKARVVPANETTGAKLFRLAAATVVEFAREYPKEALEIVRREILDKRK